MTQLRVHVDQVPGVQVTTVALVGDVDLDGAVVLSRAVEEIARGSPASVCVDLSGTTFAGSSLLRFLAALRSAIGDDAQLVLSRPSSLVRRMITVTGLNSILTFDATDTDAGVPAR